MLSISTSKMAASVDDNQIGLMSSASSGCRNKPFAIKRKSSCPNLESWKFERQVNINKYPSTQEVNISEVSVEVDSTFINETCCLSSIWKSHSTNNEERRSSAEVSKSKSTKKFSHVFQTYAHLTFRSNTKPGLSY